MSTTTTTERPSPPPRNDVLDWLAAGSGIRAVHVICAVLVAAGVAMQVIR